MMTPQELGYVRRTLANHIHLHFHDDAVASYRAAHIAWVSWDDLVHQALPPDASIIIPIVSKELIEPVTWTVSFRGTTLTFWDRLPLPRGWQHDDVESPLWYRSPQGHLMPAWDLAGTMFDLLTMHEERVSGCRDHMGRSIATIATPYGWQASGSFINNSAAVLADQCLRQVSGGDASAVLFAKPVSVCLSHDLDQLRGDDFLTQAAVMISFACKAFPRAEFSAWAYFFQSAEPRRYFMDDLLAKISAEKARGFRSICYVLCGKRGRFGARTPFRMIGRYLQEITPIVISGFTTITVLGDAAHLSPAAANQNLVHIAHGRAHYLQMDPTVPVLGIPRHTDRRVPWLSRRVGYRAGIAGPFRPFDRTKEGETSIISLPLIAMDSAIALRFGTDFEIAIDSMVHHLSVVGGTFSLLFHPGMFANPEHPETMGMYERILEIFQKYGSQQRPCLFWRIWKPV